MQGFTQEQRYRIRTISMNGVVKDVEHGSQSEMIEKAKSMSTDRRRRGKIEVVRDNGQIVW